MPPRLAALSFAWLCGTANAPAPAPEVPPQLPPGGLGEAEAPAAQPFSAFGGLGSGLGGLEPSVPPKSMGDLAASPWGPGWAPAAPSVSPGPAADDGWGVRARPAPSNPSNLAADFAIAGAQAPQPQPDRNNESEQDDIDYDGE